jgi:hypothetical protein
MSGPASNPKKSAFHSEGKMNKAGSCTAASKESSKMANNGRQFCAHRNFTVLRFSAPGSKDSLPSASRDGALNADAKSNAALISALAVLALAIFATAKTKNHRQGIAGGFGGLASRRQVPSKLSGGWIIRPATC